jgi:hypothetical protein
LRISEINWSLIGIGICAVSSLLIDWLESFGEMETPGILKTFNILAVISNSENYTVSLISLSSSSQFHVYFYWPVMESESFS